MRTEADPISATLKTEAKEAVGRIRQALGRFIGELGEPIRRPADLQKRLGLDKALGWQTYRAWSETDPLVAVRYVPRPGPMGRVLRAGKRRGISSETVEAVAEACAAFERFVETQAGDRETFESIIDGFVRNPSQAVLRDRRSAFRSLSRIWGVSAGAQINCSIFRPTPADPRSGVHAFIRGFVDVQQLRPTETFRVSSRASWKSDDPREPLAPLSHEGQDQLLEAFCSRPLPTFTLRDEPGGGQEATLNFRGLGRASALTCFLRRRVTYHQETPALSYETSIISPIPTQVMVLDLLVPVGYSDPGACRTEVRGNLFSPERGWYASQSDQLPSLDSLVHLGRSLEHLHTPEFARYREVIEFVLGEHDWRDIPFDIYRCRIEYPVLHACFHAEVGATNPPADAGDRSP